jgi:hypothetical protein
VALVRTDVLEERIASIYRKNQHARNVSTVPNSRTLFTLMMEAICSSETSVLTRATLRQIPEDGILQTVVKFISLARLKFSAF